MMTFTTWALIWVGLPFILVSIALAALILSNDPSDDEMDEPKTVYIPVGYYLVPRRSNGVRYIAWSDTAPYTVPCEPSYTAQMAHYRSPISWN